MVTNDMLPTIIQKYGNQLYVTNNNFCKVTNMLPAVKITRQLLGKSKSIKY